jgi:hypothetical protein
VEFGHLSVNISNYLDLKTTNLVMSVILLIAYNDKLKFIIIITKRLKICLERYNFDLSSIIKFSIYPCILGGISRVSYTSILA